MLELAVSRFEPDDFTHVTRATRLRLMPIVAVPAVLILAGAAVLLVRHGPGAAAAAWMAVFACLFSGLIVKQLLRPTPPKPAAMERQITLMSPMRMTFDADRLRTEMPVGRSALAYDRVAAWETHRRVCYVRLMDGRGTFVVPRRCVNDALLVDIEAFLRGKNVRVWSGGH